MARRERLSSWVDRLPTTRDDGVQPPSVDTRPRRSCLHLLVSLHQPGKLVRYLWEPGRPEAFAYLRATPCLPTSFPLVLTAARSASNA